MSARIVWTYFISRNSADGMVGDACKLWYVRPRRVRVGSNVEWFGTRLDAQLGVYPVKVIEDWFGVKPDTDLELLCVVQHPTKRMLDEAKAQQK